MMHKKWSEPQNPRPGSYVLVETKEGSYWRLKRGTLKKATVNTAYTESIARMKISAPVTKRFMDKLRPFTNGLSTGRLNARLSALFRKSLKEEGTILLRCLKGFDFQKESPIEHLVRQPILVEQTVHEVIVSITIKANTVKKMNTLITNYYFELILLYGNTDEDYGLRTESTDSDVFAVGVDHATTCVLRMTLPEQPWIALLKVNSFEGNEPGVYFKLYGLKVVVVGE